MKRASFVCLFLCLTTFLLSQSSPVLPIDQSAKAVPPISVSEPDPKAQAKILDQCGKLPLAFEANHGQTDTQVKFLSRTGGYTLFLTADEAVLALSGKKANTNKAKAVGVSHSLQSGTAEQKVGGVLRMKLRNANPAARVTGTDELAGKSNYFIGNDAAKWHSNVPTYAKVKYEGIYSGIDLVYYGNQRQLEYDFVVAPGADPHRIAFNVRGAKMIRQAKSGELVFKVGEDEIRWHIPVVYQEKNGTRQEIAAHYAITDPNRVGFEVAKYDPSRPLYIDPLIYSTYLGGSEADYGQAIALDSSGYAYVTGQTASTDFPITPGAFQTTCCGTFVTKFNPSGSALVYSTYLGGTSGVSSSIAVDSEGNAYVTGYTESTDFPVTPGAFQTTCGNPTACAFVTKFNPTGSALVYSTYLGGSGGQGFGDYGQDIAVDSGDNAYVTGLTGSSNFPVTPGAFQTTYGGAFVTKFNPTGTALIYSTYLGGSGVAQGYGIEIDNSGNAYVTGEAGSDFPTTPGAFQTTLGGGEVDAFVTKFNPTGSALIYSTYLGGSGSDGGLRIAVDTEGNVYVTGWTKSTDFPVTPGAFQMSCSNSRHCENAFVTKLNPTGSDLGYSTYLRGTDAGQDIAVDSVGNAYVTGQAVRHFPVTRGAIQEKTSDVAAFVTKFNATGSALAYSTLLGGSDSDSCWQTWGQGIAVDSEGNAYVTGSTCSTDFQITPGAFQTTYGGGGEDAFVTKLQMLAATMTTLTSSPNPSTYGQAVIFTAVVTSSGGAPPDGETVSFMKGKAVLGTGTLSGGSATFTTSTLPVGTTSVTAVYGGDSNFAGSTSKPVKQVVEKAD